MQKAKRNSITKPEETPQRSVVHRISCLAQIMREKADNLEEAEEALRWERLAKTRYEKLSGRRKVLADGHKQTTLPNL